MSNGGDGISKPFDAMSKQAVAISMLFNVLYKGIFAISMLFDVVIMVACYLYAIWCCDQQI